IEIGQGFAVLPLLPIIGVAREHEAAAMRPAREDEGARTNRVLGEGARLLTQGRTGRSLHLLLRYYRRVEAREDLREGRVRPLEMDHDLVVADRIDTVDRREQEIVVAALLLAVAAVERELHVAREDRRAVRELDARAQGQGHGEPVGRQLVGRGEAR